MPKNAESLMPRAMIRASTSWNDLMINMKNSNLNKIIIYILGLLTSLQLAGVNTWCRIAQN